VYERMNELVISNETIAQVDDAEIFRLIKNFDEQTGPILFNNNLTECFQTSL